MSNKFDKKFNFVTLIKFTIPAMCMQLILALYTIVDGIFISNFVGDVALGSTNIIMPHLNLVLAIGIMFATGGSAIVAFQMGEGNYDKARNSFSLIVFTSIIIGLIIAIFSYIFTDELITFLGASETQLEYAKQYGQIFMIFSPVLMLQVLFQVFLNTAGKPTIALILVTLTGITNIVLDYIFIVPLNMGVGGAALATVIGYSVPAIFGLIYFSTNQKGTLYFVKPKFNFKTLRTASFNGSSEMLTNLANALTTLLFNYTFMKFYGDDGVTSITIVMYFQFVFSALYFGFTVGVSPIISYKYGNKDFVQLKSIIKNSLMFLSSASVVIYIISILGIKYALKIFTNETYDVYNIVISGFAIFAVAFIFESISIFASAMFTALSNGRVSAIISAFRTLIFLVTAIIVLPLIFKETGIWLAVPVAEILGMLVSIYLFKKYRSTYRY